MKTIKIRDDLALKIEKEADKCIGCNLCMKNCPMAEKVLETPKELLEDIKGKKQVAIDIPYSCALCNYCTAVCPKDVKLRDVFFDLRTNIVDVLKTPPKELGYNSVKFHQNNSFSKVFSTDIKTLDEKGKGIVFFPGCSLSSYSPDIVMDTYEYLKEKLPEVAIALKCCGNPTYSMGESEKFSKLYNDLDREFKNNNVKEVIVACENCYKTIKNNSPDIKVSSLWEVISKHGVPDRKKSYYESLDKAFSIHDPCPTRNESKMHDAVRSILSELGIKVKEMEFTREKTLCCGSGAMIGVTSKELAMKQGEKRANQSTETCIISYCEECVESIRKGGKESIHILDLLFNKDIEETFDQEDINFINKWFNRYKSKRRISTYVKEK